MQLVYDITVVGEQNIRRALRGVEAELASSAKRTSAKADRLGTRAATPNRAAERQALAALQKLEREEASATKRSERERIAAEKRVERERLATARRVAAEEERGIKQVQAAATKAAKQHANTLQSFGRGVGTSVANTGRSIAMVGGTILGAVGAMGAGEAVSQEIGLDQRVRQVTVNARQSGETAADPKALRSHVRDTALATGATESGLIGAVETYTARTGDIKTATANLRTFATVAMATGASVEDVASTAADLAQKFNITKPKEMADAFAVLAFQGKKGAFELRDMASTFPEMAAAAQRMGMKGVGGMKTLGGLAQLARTSTGSGAEASTAVQMMLTQLTMEAGNLKSGKALGGRSVNVFEGGDATKSARDIREVLADVISKSHGNMTQLAGLFDARGVRAASPLITAYRSASDAAGGGSKGEAAGRAAVLKTISEASDAAAYFTEVEKDAADVAKSDAVKLEKINTQLREAFATKLMPAIERLLPKFEALIPQIGQVTGKLADLTQWIVANPFSGLGSIVAGKVALDLGEAGIGAAAKAALQASIAQSAAGGISVGRMTANASTATLAIAALTWAWSEADSLGKDVGAKGRATDALVPGMSGNKFSWGQAGKDALGLMGSPLGYLADKGGSIAGDYAQAAWHTVNDVARPMGPADWNQTRKPPPGTPTETVASSVAGAEAQMKATAEFTASVKEFGAAVRSGGPPPSRTSPIVSPSRN